MSERNKKFLEYIIGFILAMIAGFLGARWQAQRQAYNQAMAELEICQQDGRYCYIEYHDGVYEVIGE